MCTVCGLPSSHANIAQTLGFFTLVFGALTTFTGAWIIVTSARVKQSVKNWGRWLNKKRGK